MHINDFIKLDLKLGDYICIMNAKGEGFWGNYDGSFDNSKNTFSSRNHSNGKTETVEINRLQRLDLSQRA